MQTKGWLSGWDWCVILWLPLDAFPELAAGRWHFTLVIFRGTDSTMKKCEIEPKCAGAGPHAVAINYGA
jgi:hypothetical protein